MRSHLIFALMLIMFIAAAANSSASLLFQVDNLGFSTCSCDILESTIYIDNTGTSEESVFITQQGTAAPYSVLQADFVVAKPGEQVIVKNWLNLPCSTAGIYELTTHFESAYKIESITQRFDIRQCANMGVQAETLKQQGCGCEDYVYHITVSNRGSYLDEYTAELASINSAVALSEYKFTLQPEDANILFVFISPGCDFVGELSTTINLASKQGGYHAEVPLTLVVDDCFGLLPGQEEEQQSLLQTISARKILIASFIFWFVLLLLLLLFFLIFSGKIKSYYRSVRFREPKLRVAKRKQIRVEVS
ncbi:hypothetical protein KY320_00815, partial [Candidatus Woesearchaeota archaeon]|nr:hypothetical protein [Candidatus Woesearchaeota archaeon]